MYIYTPDWFCFSFENPNTAGAWKGTIRVERVGIHTG